MTRQRNDGHSTEFGLWLRKQDAIASARGFVATNVDYVWANYKTGEWMLLEEKRHGSRPTFSQQDLFNRIDSACKSDPKYRGFYLIVFENTSPDDGAIWIDNRQVTAMELVSFLQFHVQDMDSEEDAY